MANYIVSYDLNGDQPSHEQMDEHLQKLDAAVGRVLESVWYVGYSGSLEQLRKYVQSILSSNDLLLVIYADEATWTNLLVDSDSLRTSWLENR
jgi:hypothetical protein